MGFLQRIRLRAARRFARKTFGFWRSLGLHVVPVSFLQPIPDTRELGDDIWIRRSEIPGVEMNEAAQLGFLRECEGRFKAEYDAFPAEPTANPLQYHERNGTFRSCDAEVLYCMVRARKPRRICE